MNQEGETMKKELHRLIANARILGLPYDSSLPTHLREIFKSADDHRRHLSHIELKEVCAFSSMDSQPLLTLQENADLIVEAAKSRLLKENPELIEIGGALFPEYRAEACWRDCWHFLRFAIYAAAADRPTFTHPPGVEGMSELYKELNVPIPSLAMAMKYLQEQAVGLISKTGHCTNTTKIHSSLQHLQDIMAGDLFQFSQ